MLAVFRQVLLIVGHIDDDQCRFFGQQLKRPSGPMLFVAHLDVDQSLSRFEHLKQRPQRIEFGLFLVTRGTWFLDRFDLAGFRSG